MDWRNRIRIQATYEAQLSEKNLVLFDIQTDTAPTEPLLHRESRFLYVLSGDAKIRIQESVHEMRPGVLLTLQPWQISEIIEVKKPVTYYLLIYKSDAILYLIKHGFNLQQEPLELLQPLQENHSVQISPAEQPRLCAFFEDIRAEVGLYSMNVQAQKKKLSNLYLTARLTELIIYYCRAVEKGLTTGRPAPTQEPPLESLFQYLYFNLSRDLSLSKLASVFHRSESSLSKYIYAVTGLGFYELLFEMKSMKIEFLLLYTPLSLEQIALMLNLSDAAQVSKFFTEDHELKATPYRELHHSLRTLLNLPESDEARAVLSYISQHATDDLDIVQVSKHFNLSPQRINEILKYYVELNFSNFLRRLRLAKACDLLLHTELPIIDIALLAGFGSPRTMNRHFVKVFSMTPTEFRKTTFDGY